MHASVFVCEDSYDLPCISQTLLIRILILPVYVLCEHLQPYFSELEVTIDNRQLFTS